MLVILLFMLSGAFIGAGAALLLRDLFVKRRAQFLARQAPLARYEQAEVTIQTRAAEPAAPAAPALGTPPGAAETVVTSDAVTQAVWPGEIAAASAAAGEPPLDARAEPVAAIDADGRFGDADNTAAMGMQTPGGEMAVHADTEGTDQRAADTQSAPAPAKDLRTRIAEVTAVPTTPAAEPPRAREPDAASTAAEAWEHTLALVTSAVRATNGAFAQVGARLVLDGTHAPADQHTSLRVEVMGQTLARLGITRLPHELELAVTSTDDGKAVGRKRRVPADGLTVASLAELIAAATWPAIARHRERQLPA